MIERMSARIRLVELDEHPDDDAEDVAAMWVERFAKTRGLAITQESRRKIDDRLHWHLANPDPARTGTLEITHEGETLLLEVRPNRAGNWMGARFMSLVKMGFGTI